MNREQFIQYVNRHLPPGVRRITVDDLNRWREFELLVPKPIYIRDHLHIALGLLKFEELLAAGGTVVTKTDAPYQTRAKRLPSATRLSQVVAMDNRDGNEKAQILRALVATGLIAAPGYVTVNYSPFTGQTIASVEGLLREEGSPEPVVGRELVQFQEQKESQPSAAVAVPVLFIKSVGATNISLCYLVEGRRFLGPGTGWPGDWNARGPVLYREFLNVPTSHPEDFTDFLDQNYMFPFSVPGGDPPKFAIEQSRLMKQILRSARDGTLGTEVLQRLMPIHEDGFVDPDTLMQQPAEPAVHQQDGRVIAAVDVALVPLAKQGSERAQTLIPVRRYYRWIDYLWASLLDDIMDSRLAPMCQRCGRVLQSQRQRYCGKENPPCYKARRAEHTARWRRRRGE